MMKLYTIKELLAYIAPPKECYVGNNHLPIVERGKRFLIFGHPSSWKSMIMYYTTLCVASGKPWFGHQTMYGRVLNIQLEDDLTDSQDKIGKMMRSMEMAPLTDDAIHFSYDKNKFGTGYGINELEQVVKLYKPNIIIIDPLYKVFTGRLTDEYDVRQFQDKLEQLQDKYHFALILVHHSKKATIMDGVAINIGSDGVLGSALWEAWLDTMVEAVLLDDDTARNTVKVKLNWHKLKHKDKGIYPIFFESCRDTLMFDKVEEQEFRCGTPIEILRGRPCNGDHKSSMPPISPLNVEEPTEDDLL
jgi:RecA-family ATPase